MKCSDFPVCFFYLLLQHKWFLPSPFQLFSNIPLAGLAGKQNHFMGFKMSVSLFVHSQTSKMFLQMSGSIVPKHCVLSLVNLRIKD